MMTSSQKSEFRSKSATQLKKEIRQIEWDIEDLENQLSDAREKLEQMEGALSERLRRGDDDSVRMSRQMAREVLSFPYLTGCMHDLAMRIVEDGADDEEFQELREYHEMRLRERGLAQGERRLA